MDTGKWRLNTGVTDTALGCFQWKWEGKTRSDEVIMPRGKSKSKYAITIEVDFYGDQENVVVKKGGKIYIYPVEDNPDLFDKLSRLEGEPGVKIKDKREQARLTVYSQMEKYTAEEYDNMFGIGDVFQFRWF